MSSASSSTPRSSASARRGDGPRCVRSRGRAQRSSIGHDMRESARPSWPPRSPRASPAQGLDVVDIGLASTDMLYFASGALDLPGAMFTASHNPARYNGIKLCRAGRGADRPGHRPAPTIRRGRRGRECRPGPAAGTVSQRDLLARLRRLPARPGRPVRRSGRCRWSSTPATAWAGTPCPAVLGGLPLRRRAAVLRARRQFPNHEANPLDPANLVDLQKRVVAERRRPRAGLRRRRRPLLRGRRARRAGQPRARSPALVAVRELAKAPGRDGHPQPDHLAGRAGDRHRARRHARCGPGSGTRSSSRDGRDRRGVRRRALRALLLPRLLAGRHRHAGRAARAGRARRAGRAAVAS